MRRNRKVPEESDRMEDQTGIEERREEEEEEEEEGWDLRFRVGKTRRKRDGFEEDEIGFRLVLI